MKTAREIFEKISREQDFQRANSAHPLDLYCGLDETGRLTLLLGSEDEPPNLVSTKVIEVKIGQREDCRWALSFSLADNDFKDLFLRFCDDIITASSGLKNADRGGRFVATRYNDWQKMLSAVSKDVLSSSEIKGLIGELIFLRDVLMPNYGKQMALQSWTGPEKASQDFIFPNTWYEVKTTRSGTNDITISSVEQLDSDQEGTLAVLFLDPTSRTDEKGITLNRLYNEFSSLLNTEEFKIFELLLLKNGYFPRKEYDNFIYRPNGRRLFRVDENFPCLRRNQIPVAVVNASWTLSLAAVSDWLKE